MNTIPFLYMLFVFCVAVVCALIILGLRMHSHPVHAELGRELRQLNTTLLSSGLLLEVSDRHLEMLSTQAVQEKLFDGFGIEVKITQIGKEKPFPRHVHTESDQVMIAWTGRTMLRIYDEHKPHLVRFEKELVRNGSISGAHLVGFVVKGQHHDLVTHDDVSEILTITIPPIKRS